MSTSDYIKRNEGFITSSKLQLFLNNSEEYKLTFIDWISSEWPEARHFVIWRAIDDLLSHWAEYFEANYHVDKGYLKEDLQDLLDAKWVTYKKADSKRVLEKLFYWSSLDKKERLTAGEGTMIMWMYKEFLRQPLADLGWEYEPQKELIVEYKGWKLKGTMDRFSKVKALIRDYKTTANLKKFWYELTTWMLDWYIFQLAFYKFLAREAEGVVCECLLDVIDKTATTCSEVYSINAERIDAEMPRVMETLDKFIEAHETGNFSWPPPDMRWKVLESPLYPILDSAIQKEITIIT